MNIPVIPNNHSIRETDSTRETVPKQSSKVVSRQDKVTLGEESLMVSRLISHLKEIQNAQRPDLDSLKQEIMSGTYQPSPDKIAKAILFGPPAIK